MGIRVQVVHRTRDRLRLRIPHRRKDIPYFLRLYEDLRRLPGIRDLVINPITGSVLLYLRDAGDAGDRELLRSLERMGLLELDRGTGAEPTLPGWNAVGLDDLFASGLAGLSGLIVTLVLGLVIRSERRPVLLAPALVWSLLQVVGSLAGGSPGSPAGVRTSGTPAQAPSLIPGG